MTENLRNAASMCSKTIYRSFRVIYTVTEYLRNAAIILCSKTIYQSLYFKKGSGSMRGFLLVRFFAVNPNLTTVNIINAKLNKLLFII